MKTYGYRLWLDYTIGEGPDFVGVGFKTRADALRGAVLLGLGSVAKIEITETEI